MRETTAVSVAQVVQQAGHLVNTKVLAPASRPRKLLPLLALPHDVAVVQVPSQTVKLDGDDHLRRTKQVAKEEVFIALERVRRCCEQHVDNEYSLSPGDR